MDDDQFVDVENITIEDSDEEITSDSTSSLSEDLKNLIEEDKTPLQKLIFDKVIETKTPEEMVINLNGEIISLVEFLKNKKSLLENYNYFYDKGIIIDSKIFLLSFYLANKDKSSKYLISNFNNFRRITNDQEYLEKLFNTYRDSFEESYNYRYNISVEKSKKYNFLYDKLKKISIFKIDEIFETVKMKNSEIQYSMEYENNKINKDFGKVIFDNIEVNNFFPFVFLVTEKEKYYKIYSKELDFNYYINLYKKIEKSENQLFILINGLRWGNKFIDQYITIDLVNGTTNIQYPENSLEYVKDKFLNFIPQISLLNEVEKNISGEFKIIFPDYNEFKFYYMTLFDDLFSEFIFVREENSVRSLKENVKYYYVGTDIIKKELDYSAYFYIENITQDFYNITFKSKFSDVSKIFQFIKIFSKLTVYYNEIPETELEYYKIIQEPYTGSNGNGMGGILKEELKEKTVRRKKKLDQLMDLEPELFSKRLFSRTCPCPKQPIIVSEKDVKDWEKYELNGEKSEVVLFPPKDSKQNKIKRYYTCPDDVYRKVSFKENPDKQTSDFPVIPCCSINKTNEELYKNYDKILEGKYSFEDEYKGKSSNILKTFKILLKGRKGIVPDYIKDILEPVVKEELFREGTYRSKNNSFLHCVLTCSLLSGNELKNIEKNKDVIKLLKYYRALLKGRQDIKTENEENIIISFRLLISNLGEYNDISDDPENEVLIDSNLYSQELYNFTNKEIQEIVEEKDIFFDSKYFYRMAEILFDINVFVFVFNKNTGKTEIEIPNHKGYHNRQVREDLDCIILLRHDRGMYEDDVYEIVKRGESYLFDKNVSSYLKNIIDQGHIYSIENLNDIKSNNYIVRKNSLVNIDWTYILRDYRIVSQMINSSGRAYSFVVEYGKKIKNYVSIFIKESFPLNIPKSDTIFAMTKKKCIDLFGNNFIEGNSGLFYSVNDYDYGLFVPCTDVTNNKKSKMDCFSYVISLNKEDKNREISHINLVKNNALIFKDLIIWLYLIEKSDFEKWWSNNVVFDGKLNPQIFNSSNFKVNYILPSFKSTKEGIKHLNLFLPEIFDKKIFLYKELYENTRLFLKNFIKNNNIEFIENKKILTNCLKKKSDFEIYSFNTLIISEKKYNFWVENINYQERNYQKIEDNDIELKNPFFFVDKKTSKSYFIVNNENHNLKICIIISYIWENLKKIILQEEEHKYWQVIERYALYYTSKISDKKVDFFGWDFDRIKTYTEELTSKKYLFKNISEYFNKLYELNAEFTYGKDFSYIVYSTVDDEVKIVDTYIVDDHTPYELYLYQEGGYASMLPVN